MSEVTDAADAASWLTAIFNEPGSHPDDRTLDSLEKCLQDEFKEMPKDIRGRIRAGLNICLKELQDPSTQWYDENGDEYPRADELLLFANDNGGVVVDSNRGEVLNLVEAIPEDIDERIQHPRKEVRKRCIQTLVGILGNDEASIEFIGRKRNQYSMAFLERDINPKGPSIAMTGMEKFHGQDALYEFVLSKDGQAFENLLWHLQIIVACSHSKDEWGRIMARDGDTMDQKKSQVLQAIKEGLENCDDLA